MSNTFTEKLTSSRGMAIALGIGAALLAGILLLVYLDRYRESVAGDNAPTSVLVATATIPAGTSGAIIAQKTNYQTSTLPQKDVKVGAVSDPAYLAGRVAATDILPGQQFTTADFSAETTTAVDTKITGFERGVSVPVDAIRMSTSQIAVGDTLDLYIALGDVVKLFKPKVLVLAVPAVGAVDGSYILQVNTQDTADLMAAVGAGTLWAAIRPAVGAKPTAKKDASLQTVLRR